MTDLKFGINRMVAPTLELEGFLDLAGSLGAAGVELRNDLEGLSVVDSVDPARVRAMLEERDLKVLTINAVQHFNLPSEMGSATEELRRLIGFAEKLGHPAIVMCPHCDTSDNRSPSEMARDTQKSLVEYLPILDDAGVTGLVEPLGFPESSLRDTAVAAEIVGEIGSATYRLTLDTFHFAVAGMNVALLGSSGIPAGMVGLVHVSGVKRDGPVGNFRDPDRVLVDSNDRCDNIEQLKRLISGGYSGVASFEPFSPSVHALPLETLKQNIRTSIDYVRKNLI